MIREIAGQEFWCGIPSYQRPGNVEEQTEKCGAFTWYVLEDEADAYREAGAAVRVGETRGVGAARQDVLDDGFAEGLPVLMVDDYETAGRLVTIGDKHPVPISFDEAVEEVWARLSLSDYYLGGTSQSLNPFYIKQRTKTHVAVSGMFLIVKPSEPRFRNEFFCGEDTDFSAQHIHRYGGLVRCDDAITRFRRYVPGGCTEVRQGPDWREKAFLMLRSEWGSSIQKTAKGRTCIRYRP